jgi:3-deoxy-D-manno-octulosonic-acid transferase
MIVNARLSGRSLRGYASRCAALLAFGSCAACGRLPRSRARMRRAIGCWVPIRQIVTVSGNMKFDMPMPQATVRWKAQRLREQWGPLRPVWMAASTHEGEELAVLEAHLEVLKRLPDALLLIAPRHPERFRMVEQSVRSLGFTMATRSADRVAAAHASGFRDRYDGRADAVFCGVRSRFVGGSLVPIGGHNVLEPAALSTPVLVGPHTFNFEEITLALIRGGGAKRVLQSEALGEEVLGLLHDTEQCTQMGRQARVVFDSERGAVERVMKLIDRMLQE